MPEITTMSTVTTTVSGKRVLLYNADGGWAPTFRSNLIATGLFAAGDVDLLTMPFPAPHVSVLAAYDCVIAWTNAGPPDPVGQGDVLRSYVDGGGGVVLAVYGYSSPTNPWELQGGITLPGYSPLDITTTPQTVFPRSLNFATALTGDPLLDGVTDFTYGGNGNYVNVTLDPGATLVGVDNHGIPLVAINAARNVAGINLFPGGAFFLSPGVFRTFANACISTADQTSPNQAPVANPGDGYIGDEGSAVAFDGSGSSDPDGDALTYDWDFGDGNTGTGVSPTHTYGDNGFYTVTLTVDDGKGGTSTVQTGAKIANVNPDLGALSVPGAPLALVSGGTVVTVSGAYTDPGTLDTHTGSLACDGGTAGAVTAAAGNASGTCTFTAAGVYTVSMTVTDDDGGSDTETASSYIVVYDPSAGFVTGGGWIHSAAGSYADDVTLEGKATFGFVSKYQKGASTPVGNTEFQFHAGAFAFKSSSYQWLVIAGARAQYKGEGQVMGRAGTYGFLVTAIDGAVSGGGGVDKFRIKVWDVVTGAIVYDNRMGDAEDSAAATALGGGSIVIHAK
jgi:PKD repeat protein